MFRYLRGTISTESRHVGKRSLQVGHPFDNSQITGKPKGILPRVNANGAGSRKNRRGAKSSPQALKRENIFDDLTARLKSCPPNAVLGGFARWTAEGGWPYAGLVALEPL